MPRLSEKQRELKERRAQIKSQMGTPNLSAAVYAELSRQYDDLGKQFDRAKLRGPRRVREKQQREQSEKPQRELTEWMTRDFLAFHFVCDLFQRFRNGDPNTRQKSPWHWLAQEDGSADDTAQAIEAAERFTTSELLTHLDSACELQQLVQDYELNKNRDWQEAKPEHQAEREQFVKWFHERFN